jgi:tetratricopeptide (TPR) repeat protein
MVLRRLLLTATLSCLIFAPPVRAQFTTRDTAGPIGSSAPRDSFQQGAYYYQAGRWPEAATAFEDFVLSEAPTGENQRTHDARFYLGESLIQLQDYAKAVATYQQFLAVAEPHDANRVRAHFQLGVAAFAMQDWRLANQALRTFLTASSPAEAGHDGLRRSAQRRLADVCFELKKYEEAANLYRTFAEAKDDPEDHWEALYGQARSLELAAKHDEAEQLYLLIAESSKPPHGDRALLALGLMEHSRGQFQKSLANFHCLNDQFPSSNFLADARYWIGRAHLELQQLEEAIDSFQAARQLLRPGPGERFRSAIAFHLGVAFYKQQEYDRATQELESVLQEDANAADVWRTRSQAVLRKISMATAIVTPHPPVQDTVDLFGGAADEFDFEIPSDTWAKAERQQAAGQFEKAARTYLRIAALHPQTTTAAEAMLAAAECYQQAGHTDDAVEILSRLTRQHGSEIANRPTDDTNKPY